MPRRPGKLSAEEKRLRAQVLKDFARDKKLAQAPASVTPGKSNAVLRGPGARLLRATVGKEVYDTALERFGGKIIARAAREFNKAQKDAAARRAARLSKQKAALLKGGLKPADLPRHRARALSRVRVPDLRISRMKKGHYRVEKRVGQKWKPTGKKYSTARGVQSAKFAYQHLKMTAKIAETLGISLTRAKEIVRDVKKKAVRDLETYKKTSAYKKRGARWKRGLTAKRWRFAALMSLYSLMEIEFES